MSDLPSMIDLGVNIADAEAPAALPVGQYPAEVRSAEPKQSSTGNYYLSVAFYISPDDYPPDYDVAENPDGVTLSYIGRWPQDGKDKRGVYSIRKMMEALQVPFTGSKVDLEQWVGHKAIVNVVHETYEGEVRAKIRNMTKDI